MSRPRRPQRGLALFTAVFLLVVLAAIAAMVARIATTQQLTSARALSATRAYYVARARLDEAIAHVVNNGTCPATGPASQQNPPASAPDRIEGFTTEVEACVSVSIDEGGGPGGDYMVFTLRVSAYRGDRTAGTLVRRELRAVVTNK